MRKKLKFSSNTELKFKGEKDIKGQVLEFAHEHAVKIVVVGVVIASIAASLFIFMNRDKDNTVSKNGKIITTEPADTNYIGIVQPESFDPLASNDADIYYINQIIYSQLFTLDDGLNIKPDLVDNYTTDPEDGSVSIKLRKDAKFSDGSDVTAEDVRYTVKQINSIGETSPYYVYASKIGSIDTDGDKSLVIRFSDKADAALDNLVFPIVSSDSYAKNNEFPVGSGPYAYDSYEHGKEVQLKKNDNYYGKKAKNGLKLTVLPAENQLIGLMAMDVVTFAMSTDASVEEVAADKSLDCTSVVSSELEFIGFNHKKGIFKKKNVRSAVAHAIDVDNLIEETYGDSAVKTNSLYYPDFLGSKGGGISFDQEASAEWLKKSGYSDSDKDGFLENSKGEVLTVKLLVNSDNKKRSDSAEIICKNLAAVGINVEPEYVEAEEYTERLESGEFEMYLGGIKIDKQFNLTDMFGEYNYGKYSNKKVKSKVAALEKCLDAEGQKKAFEATKKILNEEIPYFPICYKNYYMLSTDTYKSSVKGTFFDCYRGIPVCEWEKTVAKEEQKKDN